MKKKLLAILLALVLCFSVVAVVACNPDEGDGGNDVEIPVEEGYLTLYWNITSESVALPDYASYWFIGSPVGWNTTPSTAAEEGKGCLEAKNIEGSSTWYVQIDINFLDAENSYKVVMGYSSTAADVPDANKGVIWNPARNHSIEAKEEGSDLKFAYAEGDTKVKGTDLTFEEALGEYQAPAPLSEVALRVAFKVALPENAAVYIVGDFNDNDDAIDGAGKASLLTTTSETDARKDRVWQITVENVKTLTTYEYTIFIIQDASNLDEEKTVAEQDGVIQVVYAGGKMSLEFTSAHEGSYVALAGTSPNASADAFEGLDLTEADGGKLEIAPLVTVTLTITFTEALPEGYNAFIAGSLNGWSGEIMTASADRKTWTLEIELISGLEYEFKVIVRESEDFDWSGTEFGTPKADGSGMDNAKLTVPADGGVLNLFDAAQIFSAPSTDE